MVQSRDACIVPGSFPSRLYWRIFSFGHAAKRLCLASNFPNLRFNKTALLLIVIASQGFLFGCSESRARIDSPVSLVARREQKGVALSEGVTVSIPCQATLIVEPMPKGGGCTVQFWLYNPGQNEVSVGPIDTSCECLVLTVDGSKIGSGAKVKATLRLDFSNDPSYSGGLLLEGTVMGSAGSPPLLVVRVDVAIN